MKQILTTDIYSEDSQPSICIYEKGNKYYLSVEQKRFPRWVEISKEFKELFEKEIVWKEAVELQK